jgi:RHS repeat-associated protein
VANPAAAQLPRSPKTQAFEGVVMYYGYRFYDPETGRWPSRDPIAEDGGINLYGFVGNDGVRNWDLLGLSWFGFGPGQFPGPAPRPVDDLASLLDLDLEALATLEAAGQAARITRPLTSKLLLHYIHGGGSSLTLSQTDMDIILAHPGFKSAFDAELARVVRSRRLSTGEFEDKGVIANYNFDKSQGDLFSAFHDMRWKIDVKGCIEREWDGYFFAGDVTLSVEDKYGFSDPKNDARTPFLVQGLLPDRYQYMPEGRFRRLEKRGLAVPFDVKGSQTNIVYAKVPYEGGASRVDIVPPINTY